METFKKIIFFLTPQEKRHASLLLIMIIIMGIIDTMGIASILPFMAVIANPNIIETNIFLKNLFQISGRIGVETNNEFILLLGILVFFFLIFSLSFKAITIYIQTRFCQLRGHTIGKKLLETYLNQPYSWFLNHNSAALSKNILSEVSVIIGQGMTPILNLVTYSIISIFLLILLFLINFKLTIIVIFVIGGSYFFIYFFFKKFIHQIGKERLFANTSRFKSINEAFGAYKQVKVTGLEKYFINLFSEPSLKFAKYNSSSLIIGSLPRFFIEAISFGGLILIIIYFLSIKGSFVNSIPTIAVFTFAGYRIMPSVQIIYQAFTSLKFSSPIIDKVYNDLKYLKKNNFNKNKSILSFNNSIRLNQVNYKYPNSSRPALKNINLIVPAKTIIGFTGPTGCGKTTTVDIILGLLEPQNGNLEVDGNIITAHNRRSWQQLVGYVPQQIYLTDDTIASNIAFGIDSKNINHERVQFVSKIASLHNFIVDELQFKYETIIGENGVKLSGGQRQRIGIARALYNNPKLLILDEATSALDNETEKAVMNTINKLRKNITIILIAHRLNTVRKCDMIFKFKKGQIVKSGNYNQIINN